MNELPLNLAYSDKNEHRFRAGTFCTKKYQKCFFVFDRDQFVDFCVENNIMIPNGYILHKEVPKMFFCVRSGSIC